MAATFPRHLFPFSLLFLAPRELFAPRRSPETRARTDGRTREKTKKKKKKKYEKKRIKDRRPIEWKRNIKKRKTNGPVGVCSCVQKKRARRRGRTAGERRGGTGGRNNSPPWPGSIFKFVRCTSGPVDTVSAARGRMHGPGCNKRCEPRRAERS